MESDKQYELRLTAEPQRLAVVRRIVMAHLRHWKMAEAVDLCLLGVTELLANVHRHVGPGAECLLRLTAGADGLLRCEVHDTSTALPRVLTPDEEEINGRGLALVAALSADWGAQVEEGGKVVWFALKTVPHLAEAPLAEVPPSTPLRLAPLRVAWTGPTPPSRSPATCKPASESGKQRGREPVRLRA
ncbi:ATP-binding protein [Streptacidiphilus sp. EB103A]|uniref:ATP-binding protein n=1 Tax=Streptacidiphilus sp. EB103A TaxID=3156275 RepID=UPI00351681E1